MELSLFGRAGSTYYHFSNHRPAQLREIWQWVHECGYDVDVVGYVQWQEQLRTASGDNALSPVIPLLTEEHVRDPDRYPEEIRPCIATANTDADLRGSGISCPPVDRDLC